MLILFGPNRTKITISTDSIRNKPCEFVEQIKAYVERTVEPAAREAFERHLIDCTKCQRAVHLGRISVPSKHHNRSVGIPCATQTRRKP